MRAEAHERSIELAATDEHVVARRRALGAQVASTSRRRGSLKFSSFSLARERTNARRRLARVARVAAFVAPHSASSAQRRSTATSAGESFASECRRKYFGSGM